MSESVTPQAIAQKTDKPLAALYLFNGDDSLKQETLVDRLKQRIAVLGDATMNTQVCTAKEITSAAHLLDVLNTMPFGAPKRLVVIKEAQGLSKQVQDALVAYAKQPLESTVLALCAKFPSSSRILKAVQSYNRLSVIDCGTKKRSELPALMRGMAQGEGSDITTPAANLLIDRVGTSTVALSSEIKKLAAITKARGATRIEDGDVASNVARLVEPKPWDLTNALALRDTELCLLLLDRMQGYTAIGLFMQCITRIREILTAATLKKRGQPVAQSMGKQEWQLREVMEGTTRYSQATLINLLKDAPGIEQKMKSGADANQLLKLWLVDACQDLPQT